jgi:hypothetical protein
MIMKSTREALRIRSWAALTLAAVLTTTAPIAQAALTSYSPAGVDLVRLQNGPLDLTLTANGNLLGNFLAGASNPTALVNTIIAASGGSIADAFYGNRTLTSSDFSTDGRTTYFGARAFINYLNSTSYGGTNQWRLPGMTDTGTAGCNFSYSGTDCGYNVAPASSELARLYYSELNRIAKYDEIGISNLESGYGIFGNDGEQNSPGDLSPWFKSVRSDAYWLGLDDSSNLQKAWVFATSDGVQGSESKEEQGYVWAVTSGPVSAVPVPAPLWLLGSGLICLARLRRTRPS